MTAKKIVMGLLVGMMALSSLIGGKAVMAVSCPGGMGSADTLAQCSLPQEERSDNDKLITTLQTIVNVILSVLGIVAVIVIVIGGFTYITSAGDASKAMKARNTILYGIIGLIVALLAFAIVNFVLSNVFNGQ